MAEVRSDDIETPQSIDRLCSNSSIRLVVDVVGLNDAVIELGAGVAALTGDELCSAIVALDKERLVSGGVPRCCEDLNTGGDLFVPVDDSSSVGFDVGPLSGRVVRKLRRGEFGRLDIDGHGRQRVVLAAVIEVQAAVHDCGDVAFVDARGVEGFDDRRDLGLLVELADQWMAVTDAGVNRITPSG